MVTNTVLGLTSLAIGAAVLTHTIAMWQIFTAATIFGVMTCLENPARMAFVPELVGIALILPAVTTNSIMANVGRTLGPVVAAVLAHNFGLGWCFVANAASFAVVVVTLLALDVAAEIGWTIPLKRQRADVPPCPCYVGQSGSQIAELRCSHPRVPTVRRSPHRKRARRAELFMSTEPEPDSERKVHAEPTQDDKPEPENGTHRELEPATRSARYALITAVSAAVISSFVAAGTAVYVSINQSNSSEQLAVTQAIRQDRQKVYSDFSVAMFSFMQQLGNVSGLLQARGSIESVRPEISELSGRQGEFLASLNLLLMAGSPEMQEVGGRFAEAVFAFSRDHVAPFAAQYIAANAPRANDTAGRERDSAALVVAINDLTTKIGELNAAFVAQGINDLR